VEQFEQAPAGAEFRDDHEAVFLDADAVEMDDIVVVDMLDDIQLAVERALGLSLGVGFFLLTVDLFDRHCALSECAEVHFRCAPAANFVDEFQIIGIDVKLILSGDLTIGGCVLIVGKLA